MGKVKSCLTSHLTHSWCSNNCSLNLNHDILIRTPHQHSPPELPVMMEMFMSVLSSAIATSNTYLLSTLNLASATLELNY